MKVLHILCATFWNMRHLEKVRCEDNHCNKMSSASYFEKNMFVAVHVCCDSLWLCRSKTVHFVAFWHRSFKRDVI